MPRLPLVLASVMAIGLGAPGSAHADDKAEALALFEKSDKAYKAGKFERAVKLLQDAYRLYPEPLLLYNLGRAQEGMGDVPAAITSYKRYLKDAKQIQDRGAIERRIATLEAHQREKTEEAKRLAEEEARRKQAEEDRRKAEQERLRLEEQRQREARSPVEAYGPWITIGAGVSLVATGFVFGARASSTHDDAIATSVQLDAIALQDSAERSATIANVLFVVGGITTAAGIGWKVWQWKRGDGTSAQVTAAPNAVAIGGTW